LKSRHLQASPCNRSTASLSTFIYFFAFQQKSLLFPTSILLFLRKMSPSSGHAQPLRAVFDSSVSCFPLQSSTQHGVLLHLPCQKPEHQLSQPLSLRSHSPSFCSCNSQLSLCTSLPFSSSSPCTRCHPFSLLRNI
jgi:hypothetical protein